MKRNIDKELELATDISVKEAYPNRADGESHHTALESRLFALLGNPLVDTLSQPNVSLHVPRIEQHLEVFGKFDIEHTNIGSSIPKRPAFLVVPSESETGNDGGTLYGDIGQ